tara:strand:- start:15918 stop:16850 length:933 start_codon:yes stop_codon:yes gene_type:complete
MKGWISVQKQIRNHWVWEDPRYLRAWMDMLMMANYTEQKKPYKETIVLIKRGEFPASIRGLSERWDMATNTVRNFLNRLKTDTMIDTHTKYGFTLVKIVNYDKYQSQTDTLADTVGDTLTDTLTDTVTDTTIINNNNINKKNNSGVGKKPTPTLKDRFAIFTEKAHKIGKEKGLDKQEIEKFINHWGAHNEGGKKMRWEMEKVFDLPRRMNTWKSNNDKWNFSSGVTKQVVQSKEPKKTTYICFGCDKTKEVQGEITAEETFCECGDQFMKDWEYRTLKAKDQPGGPKKKKPPIEAQVMKEVGFKLKTMT